MDIANGVTNVTGTGKIKNPGLRFMWVAIKNVSEDTHAVNWNTSSETVNISIRRAIVVEIRTITLMSSII